MFKPEISPGTGEARKKGAVVERSELAAGKIV